MGKTLHRWFLTKEQMKRLNTRRLLAYKDKLMCYRSPSDDWCMWERSNDITKASPEWQEAYDNIKSILAKREHVEK